MEEKKVAKQTCPALSFEVVGVLYLRNRLQNRVEIWTSLSP